VESLEVRPGLVLDLDAAGQVVGIDIDHASDWIDLPPVGERMVPFVWAVAGR
jgi:uncharacterized protein YuzE